jgi:hypothetical protein
MTGTGFPLRGAVLSLALLLAACGGHRGAGPKVEAPLGPPLAETLGPEASAPSDSTTSATPTDSTAVAVPAPPKSPPGAKEIAPSKPSGSPPASTSPASPPEPKISSQQEVGVELDAATKADLAAQTRKDLDEAERLVRTLASGELSADRRERVATVDSMITSARAALDTDLEAAAALARKARLLAEEIARS